ncbi:MULTISPECIES: intradiol ring-cleavage dioxygenase [Caldilinea]|uniref:Putative dioxygenase n=1 Tax=Caldilinea aerophila (strain DSM 14535 / JCM 11387 / NBRC 104270 / STL-6-O1) TaxID=926550 RepID=I0I5C2_CALAS|nr:MULTISPECIES: intradiol ring-cleavage dioxygenase [Caldilinea]BAM00460.1 putative dioxygenase [Caldilinea aerophila DSM 14535 = NBRC 104270]GIV71810.1 MAG: intradiol ring-cleavage dioxygenase [Caldilinea sp.]
MSTQTHYPAEPAQDLYDLGLRADLAMLSQSPMTRRRVLSLGLLGISALLAGCAPIGMPTPAATTTQPGPLEAGATTGTVTECVSPIPRETAGPFPGNGSQGPNLNVLRQSGVVRPDIRTSLGTGNTAEGIPMRLELTLVRAGGDCAPLPGYAVYLWHCDARGRYSMYSPGAEDEDYLRGVQAANEEGVVTFLTVFPGCYSGRWPHFHFEIYSSVEQATGAGAVVHTSQIALPEEICRTVYADSSYGNSLNNLSRLSLARDSVFRDGWESQMATVTGSVEEGFVARLTVGVPTA